MLNQAVIVSIHVSFHYENEINRFDTLGSHILEMEFKKVRHCLPEKSLIL